jgi:hypothetical protein
MHPATVGASVRALSADSRTVSPMTRASAWDNPGGQDGAHNLVYCGSLSGAFLNSYVTGLVMTWGPAVPGGSRALVGDAARRATESMVTPQTVHSPVPLHSEEALVVGRFNPTGIVRSAELYDLIAATWTASLSVARDYATATLLPSGKLLPPRDTTPHGAAL